MKKIIFYSWQSDLPNSSNRGFIKDALEKAVKLIVNDESIEVEPRIDHDTLGVGGAPDIGATILSKISNADIFVADVSIINNDQDGRKTPNPNVLIELGYALKAKGSSKVVLVMNTDYGEPELLPFDLKTKLVLTYSRSSGDKSADMALLSGKLKSQLLTIFAEEESITELTPGIISMIRSQTPARISEVRKYMSNLARDLEALYPGNGMEGGIPDPEYDQKIFDAIGKTSGMVEMFREVIDEIAIHNDSAAVKEIFAGFKPIVQKFDHPVGYGGGTSHRAMFDYYMFLGNEMFVILISIFLREEKWDLLELILESTLIVENVGSTKNVDFSYLSTYTPGFDFRKQRLNSNRASLRYDLLKERREAEESKHPSAFDEYTSADIYLFLKGEAKNPNSTDLSFNWYPWSSVMFNTPNFIFKAESKRYAEGVAKSIGCEHVQDIQVLLTNKIPGLSRRGGASLMVWRSPITKEQIDKIGTRK